MYNKDIKRVLMSGKPDDLLIDIEQRNDDPYLRVTIYRDNVELMPEGKRQSALLWLHAKMTELELITPVHLSVKAQVPNFNRK